MEIGDKGFQTDWISGKTCTEIFIKICETLMYGNLFTLLVVKPTVICVDRDIERYMFGSEGQEDVPEEKRDFSAAVFVEWFLEQNYQSFGWISPLSPFSPSLRPQTPCPSWLI